jgi:hypothetical protein
MECDSVYGDLYASFFQHMYTESDHKDKFSKIMPRALIWSQRDSLSGHMIGLCLLYVGNKPTRLFEYM